MVSDQTQGLTPYKLFQELKSIHDETTRLRKRLKDLEGLEIKVARSLAAISRGAGTPIEDVGIAVVDGVYFYYHLDLHHGHIIEFYPVTAVTAEGISYPDGQQST